MIKMDETYFFDTYAIIEILNGNKNYKEYINKNSVLTKLNIFEIFYKILREEGRDKAKNILDKYYISVVDYGKFIIEEASKFRLEYKKRKLSMSDCVGYIIAKEIGIKFLTGDSQFKDLPNVEFVR